MNDWLGGPTKGEKVAVIIRNLKGDPLGLCEYEVRINEKRITTFKHHRPAGLKACLLAAAEAVERQKWEDLGMLLDDVKDA